METKFIPGPWSFVPSVPEEGYECFWIESGVQRITGIDGPQNAEREATVRLIAAAPELFEALRAALEESTNSCIEALADPNGIEWHSIARAALAKANGEQA